MAGSLHHLTADGKTPVTGGNLDGDEFPSQLLTNFRLTQTLLPSGTPNTRAAL